MCSKRSGVHTLGRLFSVRATVVLGVTFAWMIVLAVIDPMPVTVHGDGYYTWLWARSIAFDGDVDFAADYQLCDDPWNLAHTPQGDVINQWNPGPALFWLPFLAWDLATGHPALRNADPKVANGCKGPLAERAVRGSFLAGVLTVLMAFAVARRAFGEGPALFGAASVALLTPLAYYSTMLLSYGHAASACTGGLVVLLWDRERRRSMRGGPVWLGAATGLAMLTRPQNGILAILPLCLWLERGWEAVRARGWNRLVRHVGWGLVYVLAALFVFSPQILQWWDSQGELFFVPQGRHYMRWGAPRIAQVLFSTSNGLLPWSPILYLALIGLGMLAVRRGTRSLGLPLVLLVAAATYVNACVYDWWGAIGFPGRRFDSMSVPFAIGIAAVGSAVARWQRSRPGLVPTAFAASALALLGAWSTAVQVGVAQAVRTDLPNRSDEMWLDVWGRAAHPLWEHVGNPLAWPASIPFAIRYRIHPRAWDFAGAPELFFHEWLTLERRVSESIFDFVDRHAELLVGFDRNPRLVSGRRARGLRGEYGRAIVPISWPTIGALRFDVLHPVDARRPVHVWLELDGEDLGTHRIDHGQEQLRVPVLRPHQGICELRMRVVGGWLGFRQMEILDPDPSPAELEAPYLREVAARRRAWRTRRHPGS
jgi:hypothetical protein